VYTNRVGGGAAVVGGVLALVGNLLHPRFGDEEDFEVYRKIAVSDRFVVADFILLLALLLVVAGLVTLARQAGAGPWAEYGRLVAVIGGTIAIAQFGIEMFAFKHQTEVFARASADDLNGSFWAANALDHVNTAMFDTWTLVLLGLAPILIAIAALLEHRFRLWVNVLALVGGAVCAFVGAVNLGRDDQSTLEIPFLVGSLLVTAWVVAAGADVVRREPQPSPT
jgi:hypothetical protein